MKKITNALLQVNHLEEMVDFDSFIHRLHPFIKLITTFIYIVCVTTSHSIVELLVYCLILFMFIFLSHISALFFIKKSIVALPFSLCIGLSDLLMMKEHVVFFHLVLTTGFIAMIAVMLKTFLSVLIVFLLIATTGFESIVRELLRLKMPVLFVMILLMTYRYLFLLVDEASEMSRAYMLRNPGKNGIELKDMGSFLGSLLLRSFQRSQEVYQCMQVRGFDLKNQVYDYERVNSEDYFLMVFIIGLFIMIKVVFI